MAKAKSAAVKKPTPKGTKVAPSPFEAIDPLPTDAWGRSRCAPSIATSERSHALLGLGYPHMLLTTDGDFAGSDEQLRTLMSDTRIIPRTAVERLYRLYSRDTSKKLVLAKAVTFALEVSGNHFALFALEHLFGATATATAFVDALERYPTKAWSKLDGHGVAIRGLYFLLWRTPTAIRAALIERLAAVHAKLVAAELGGWRSVLALDVVVNGRAGVERGCAGAKPFFADLLHAADDPAWVAKIALDSLITLKPADRELFTIQVGVIGGPKVIAQLRDGVAKFQSAQKKSIALQLSLCA